MNEQMTGNNGHIAVADSLMKHFESGSRTVKAVHGVSFGIPRGKMVAIRGPSGCGKSTLLNLIGALDKADRGDQRVDGLDVRKVAGPNELAYGRRNVGLAYQQFNLIHHLC